jgi:hypothetical protein
MATESPRLFHARARMGHGLLCGGQDSGQVGQLAADVTCPLCLALISAAVGQPDGEADKRAHDHGPALAASLRKVTAELQNALAEQHYGDSPAVLAALALLKRIDEG